LVKAHFLLLFNFFIKTSRIGPIATLFCLLLWDEPNLVFEERFVRVLFGMWVDLEDDVGDVFKNIIFDCLHASRVLHHESGQVEDSVLVK
jgi:hypothetical protein